MEVGVWTQRFDVSGSVGVVPKERMEEVGRPFLGTWVWDPETKESRPPLVSVLHPSAVDDHWLGEEVNGVS